MTIRDDLLKHRILVQQYAARQANRYAKALRNSFNPTKPFNANNLFDLFNTASRAVLNEMVDFAQYESRFYSKLLQKYLKQPIDKVEIRDIILESKVAYAVKQRPLGIKEAFLTFANRKVQELRQLVLDNPDAVTTTIPELLSGRITQQARALVITSINGAVAAVRLKY